MAKSAGSGDYDVIIVGAGMVGASLACLLAGEMALSVALVDANPPPAPLAPSRFDPRVVALSPTAAALLGRIGVWQQVLEQRACPYREMEVWDGEGSGRIHFDSADARAACLGHIVENSVLLSALHARLGGLAAVDFIGGEQVTALDLPEPGAAAGIRLSSGAALSAELVVAADGGQSTLRELAAIPVRQWSYHQRAIVTTVRTEHSHRFTAWQRFAQHGPLAFLPLSRDGHDSDHCAIVWSLDEAVADAMLALGDDDFCRALGRALEHRLGAVLACDARHGIALCQRHSKHYIRPGLALVGDAAHTIHPLAGQGVNLGFYDVEVLAAEIQRAQRRAVPLADFSILQRFQRQRQGHNLATMAGMEAFKRLFAADHLALRWLRNAGMTYCDRQPWLKTRLARFASGAAIR